MQRKKYNNLILIGIEIKLIIFSVIHIKNLREPVCEFVLKYFYNASLRLRTYFATAKLMATSICFNKSNYLTWKYSFIEFFHQINHFIVSKSLFKCIMKCGIA